MKQINVEETVIIKPNSFDGAEKDKYIDTYQSIEIEKTLSDNILVEIKVFQPIDGILHFGIGYLRKDKSEKGLMLQSRRATEILFDEDKRYAEIIFDKDDLCMPNIKKFIVDTIYFDCDCNDDIKLNVKVFDVENEHDVDSGIKQNKLTSIGEQKRKESDSINPFNKNREGGFGQQ